jgi:hypothetical protein
MAKFNLKAAKQAAAAETDSIEAGYHRAIITQVANVGLQKGFSSDDPSKESLGFCFELASGAQIAKVIPVSFNVYAALTAIAGATDDPEELEDYLGQQLVIEIETSGKWPKLAGFYHLEDGLADIGPISTNSELLEFDADEPEPEVLKKLHKTLREAYGRRVRSKGGAE